LKQNNLGPLDNCKNNNAGKEHIAAKTRGLRPTVQNTTLCLEARHTVNGAQIAR
jgi:hypothetical protein